MGSEARQTSNRRHGIDKETLHQLAAFLIGFSAFISVVASALVLYGFAYKDKISPNIHVAGVNIGGLSYGEAQEKLNAHLNERLDTTIRITVSDSTYETTAQTAGLAYDSGEAIDRAFTIGKQRNLITRYFSLAQSLFSRNLEDINTTYNQEAIDTYIAQIASEHNRDPQNAQIKVEANEIVITPEEEGMGVDSDRLAAQIKRVLFDIDDTQDVVTIEASINTLKPKVFQKDLEPLKTQGEELADINLALQWEDKAYNLNRRNIINWLDFIIEDGRMEVQYSDTKINSYIATLARGIDQKANDRKLSDVDRAVLEEGSDGRTLNRSATLNAIKTQLGQREQSVDQAPIALQVDFVARQEKVIRQPFTPGLYPGKYLEVNIKTQRMYLWIGSEKVGEHKVSTGKWNMPTPIGTRYIENKFIKPLSARYNLWMPYWMGLGGGYGIHELPERRDGTKEGESSLGVRASHGCIRLGIGAAKEVYDWSEVGLPVYIHEG